MTNTQPQELVAYFPNSQLHSVQSHSGTPSYQQRFPEIAPVLDVENTKRPLEPFDDILYSRRYPEIATDYSGTKIIPKPDDSPSSYLFPTLTRNERQRLTWLWYMTREALNDKELLQKLQAIIELVHAFLGRDHVFLGIIAENTFTMLATHGMPLTIVPRRETICAHTINQKCQVFELPDILGDPRFRHSPVANELGLRSYVGAQVRCETEDGQRVVLGSLCAATGTQTDRLSPEKQSALARFADIISAEIVNGSRYRRQCQRQAMGDILARVREQTTEENVEHLVKEALRDIYPQAYIALQSSNCGMIRLENRPSIPFVDTHNGLWEDSEFLERLILTQNHFQLASPQTVRAMAAPCQRQPTPRYLVVASKDVQLVFDEVDAWFVESCAAILLDAYQEQRVAEALKARESFLRGITHQLRTPIHGILGSVDLLGEELFSLQISNETNGRSKLLVPSTAKSVKAYLQTITNSGSELMSTVNNIIMLNRWAESKGPTKTVSFEELNQLEADIVRDISHALPEDGLNSTSILFDNRLPLEWGVLTIDISMLKECLQSLVLNAVQSTQNGSVLVVISAARDCSILQFDVYDTGSGIFEADQQRIFEAFEKGDSHTRGAGLGLTISSKIANSMNGSVRLVSSVIDKGSHFRAEFHDPGFACEQGQCPSARATLKELPRQYHEVPTGSEATPLVRHFMDYMEHRGYARSRTSRGALNIVSFAETEEKLRKYLKQVHPSAMSVCLLPSHANKESLEAPFSQSQIVFFHGPFLSSRLNGILAKIDRIYTKLKTQSALEPVACGSSVSHQERTKSTFNHTLRIFEPIRALLVDDNIINLRILKLYCDKRGIPYATCVDGNEAVANYIECLQTQPFNLILMDLQMPNCDGIEATKQIRQVESGLSRHAAVIFIVTGQNSSRDKLQSKEAGADEFFAKPMSIKSLDHGISRFFRSEP